MPKIVTVGTEVFEIPVTGDNAGYGEQLTDFFVAVSDSLQTVQQPNDILPTSAAIANNQSSPASIPGFLFNTAEVIAIDADATITRTTVSPAITLVENFKITGNYNGTSWTINITSDSAVDSGVSLDITSSGQMQYTSSNLIGTGYTASILFKAKVFNKDN